MANQVKKFVTLENLERYHSNVKAKFVAQEDGKGLSTNDLTDELKAQYDAAQANVIEEIKVNGSAVAVDGKSVNIEIPDVDLSGVDLAAVLENGTDAESLADLRTQLGLTEEQLIALIQSHAPQPTIPTDLSEFNNDAGFLTEEEVATQIATAIADSDKLSRQIVDALPNVGAADPTVIYMILAETATADNNIYDEWLLINGQFEKIGDTRVDLTGYVKEEDFVAITDDEIDALFD